MLYNPQMQQLWLTSSLQHQNELILCGVQDFSSVFVAPLWPSAASGKTAQSKAKSRHVEFAFANSSMFTLLASVFAQRFTIYDFPKSAKNPATMATIHVGSL